LIYLFEEVVEGLLRRPLHSGKSPDRQKRRFVVALST
jgi:hypothetical protein